MYYKRDSKTSIFFKKFEEQRFFVERLIFHISCAIALISSMVHEYSILIFTPKFLLSVSFARITLVNKDFGVMQLVTVSYGFSGAEFKNHIHFC